MRVYETGRKQGVVLMNKFLEKLPKNTGIVLDPIDIDDIIGHEKLGNWYLQFGFKQIPGAGETLFLVNGG